MLSFRNKTIVVSVLDGVLGVGSSLKGNEQAHHCPFCHHHKKKLQINLETQKWHCWVCDASGVRIKSLLKKLKVDYKTIERLKEVYGDDYEYQQSSEDYPEKLELPVEFKSLYLKPKSINPIYNQAISYLKRRGITMDEVLKYNIGYCENGDYGGRLIIPSYTESGELNYFIARSFYDNNKMKYKNPPVSRNVVVFDNQINWNEPITLVEGVFDAFSVKRNAIPLLSKFLLKELRDKILNKGVSEINILLDSDAIDDSTKHTEFFQKNGIKVKNIIPSDKDAGDMGFEKVNELIKDAEETEWSDLVLTKLKNL
jgi:DNA primase